MVFIPEKYNNFKVKTIQSTFYILPSSRTHGHSDKTLHSALPKTVQKLLLQCGSPIITKRTNEKTKIFQKLL